MKKSHIIGLLVIAAAIGGFMWYNKSKETAKKV